MSTIVLFGNAYALGKLHLIYGYQPSAYPVLVKEMAREIHRREVSRAVVEASEFGTTPEELIKELSNPEHKGNIFFVPDVLASVGYCLEYGTHMGPFVRSLQRIIDENEITIFFFVPQPITSLMYFNDTATELSCMVRSTITRNLTGISGGVIETRMSNDMFE